MCWQVKHTANKQAIQHRYQVNENGEYNIMHQGRKHKHPQSYIHPVQRRKKSTDCITYIPKKRNMPVEIIIIGGINADEQ